MCRHTPPGRILVFMSIIFLLLTSLIFHEVAEGQRTVQGVAEDCVYVEGGTVIRHGIDCYWVDQGMEPAPAVILIHGGAWICGDKADVRDHAKWLAQQGISAFSINYMLAREGRPSYPRVLDDLDQAIEWVRSQEYVDKDRISLVGFSAGGHLALMYTTRNSGLKAVVSVGGPTDLTQCPSLTGYIQLMLGTDSPEAFRAASPVRAVQASSSPHLVLIQGTEDFLVPVETQAYAFPTVRGGDCNAVLDVYRLGGADHVFGNDVDKLRQIILGIVQ